MSHRMSNRILNQTANEKGDGIALSHVAAARQKGAAFYEIVPVAASMLLLLGMGMACQNALGGLSVSWAAVGAAALAGLAGGLFFRPSRVWTIAALLCFAALILVVAANWARVRAGVASCLTALCALLTEKTGRLYLAFDGAGDPTLFLALLFLMAGVACGMLARRASWLSALLCAALFCLPCACGLLEPGSWLGIGAFGCCLLAALRASSGFLVPCASLPMILAAALAAVPIVSPGLFSEISEISEAAKQGMHEMRYERTDNPMPEGRLKNLKPFRPKDAAALEVTMERWTALYIRGFVGERYTDAGWEPLGNDVLAQNAPLLYHLQKAYFYPATQLAAACEELGQGADNQVAVHPLGACVAYPYVPYGISGFAGQDARELSKEGGSQGKAYAAALYPVADAYRLQAGLSEASLGNRGYLDGEAAYRAFVYQMYCGLPDADAQKLSRHFPIAEGTWTTTKASLAIREWLGAAMTYDADAISGSGDFLSYLLEFDGRGHSVHYATLAALLFRGMGIPARYVEGYLVTAKEATAQKDGESYVLTQKNSHAWAEYYLDGVGWLPFDATPGHADEVAYQLPENGTAGGQGEVPAFGKSAKALPKRDLAIDTSGSIGKDSGTLRVFPMAPIALLLLLLLLLALAARTLVLRGRLKRRMRGFANLPPRQGSADCFCYLLTVLRMCGLPEENIPLTQRIGAITEALGLGDPKETQRAAWLASEVWYSDHAICEEQRQQALSYLSTALGAWRKKSNAWKRFCDRWVSCAIP